MSDKYAALKSRIEKALEDFTNGRASMHVPVLDTDVDLVLYDCLELLAERDADRARIAELTEALIHSVAGYKSCLRMGYDRIIDLGGDCDAPEVMIAGNPDIQQAEKLLAAGISLKIEE